MEEHVSRSGGVDLQGTQIDIGDDVVGRDKIVQNIHNIVKSITQRPLTAAEEADLAQSIESKRLQQGVTDYIERLRDRVTAAADTGGPYKGLLEFRLSDAAVFFGRHQAISDLLEHVQRSPLTILHAESGAGKTSLLQAGISPRLIAKGHLPLYLRPYNISPTIAVKRAFLANLNETLNLAQLPLRDFLSRLCAVLGAQTTLYLFIDQFEEFFTHLEEARRAEYVNEFATCLEDDSLNVRWVLALRSEFFGSLANFRPRIRNPFENDYRLNRLTRAEARDAIAAPAAQKGIAFEGGLIDAILDDLGQMEVAPPQVQLVCSALYETLPDDAQVITRQSYAEQRGAQGILREHLGRVLRRDLPADQRPIAQHALEALVTSDVQRVLRSRTELATDLTLRDAKPDTLDQVLNQLVDSRLLRVEEIDGQLCYELAHDYLLTEIQLDPAVQARKAAQELLEQEVQAYQRYGTLLSDDKFAILAPRRAELVVNDAAQALFHKSERALKRRQRLVFGGIGLVIALIAIGLLSIVTAIGAGQQQQVALRSQQIAETAAASANLQRTDALSSAATAQALQATAEAGASMAATREAVANEALRRAFQQTGIAPVGNRPQAVTFDGTRVWVANSLSNTVQAIDPATGQVDPPITVGQYPAALVYDGVRVWVANKYDNSVQAIDPATGEVNPPIPVGDVPSALAFDGTRVWVANGYDDTVQSIEPNTRQVDRPIPVGDYPYALTFGNARVWVTNYSSGTVQSIDPFTNQVNPPIPVGQYPAALVYDGTRVWVANAGDDTMQSIEPNTGQVDSPIPVGSSPHALTFDGTRLWVANRVSNSVQVIDPKTGLIGTPRQVGNDPYTLTFDGTRIWIAYGDDNSVQAIDPTAGLVSNPIGVGTSPSALAYDGSRLWVANDFDGTVLSIDTTTGLLGTPIEVGFSPSVLTFDGTRVWVGTQYNRVNPPQVRAVDPTTNLVGEPIQIGDDSTANPAAVVFAGKRVWVANGGSQSGVQAIDPNTGQIGSLIEVGRHPIALAVTSTQVWVATIDGSGNSSVQAIDSITGQLGPRFKVDDYPSALAFDGTRLWIANSLSNTVQAIDPVSGLVSPTIEIDTPPYALAFDGTRLWVATDYDDTNDAVQSIDPATGHVSLPIRVGKGPLLEYGDKRLWIASRGDKTVQYIVVQK